MTAMYMAAEMDAGDIIEIRKTPIEPYENAQSLLDRLAEIGGGLLCDTLRSIKAGTATRTPQQHEKATFAPMLTKALCPIDWTRPIREIIDHVRGLDPWPVATTELAGKRRASHGKEDRKSPGNALGAHQTGLGDRLRRRGCGSDHLPASRRRQKNARAGLFPRASDRIVKWR